MKSTSEETRRRLDAFAEALSEHGDVERAAREAGVGSRRGWKYLKRLKDELGPQAV